MIGTFLGEQNSGKTLAMTYFANLYYKNGYKIFANYNLTPLYKSGKGPELYPVSIGFILADF